MRAWSVVAFVGSYLVFLVWRLGLHRRLPLITGRISLEAIPDRAARAHMEKPLFTTDEPCEWEVNALAGTYPDAFSWSAKRIQAVAGFIAAVLLERFLLKRGDRVAIFKKNHLDIHVLMSGVVRAGGIACPINGKFAADKLGPYLTNIGARILITDTATLLRALNSGADITVVERIILAEKKNRSSSHLIEQNIPNSEIIWIEDAFTTVSTEAPAVPREVNDVMYLVHSSGTTGFPKAVTLRNGAQSHAVRGWLAYVHLSPARDKGYLAVPNNHQAVILTFNSLLLLGLSAHWSGAYDRDGFDAAATLRKLESGKFTGFLGFPIAYTLMKEIPIADAPLKRMRFWATTADASHESIQRRFVARGGLFRSLGIPITGSIFLDAQGSSEVGTPSVLRYVTRFTRKYQRRIGRAGSNPFGPQLRIVSPSGHAIISGSVGRFEVKGRTVFDAYWNDPDLTAIAFNDGWFFTGDVARMNADGNFIQLDREVDVIHTRTGDVYSLLIEEEVHKHPAVFDTCVYAARQSDDTQLPAAWIALRSGRTLTSDELMRDLNCVLPGDSRLSRVDIRAWEEFPMGITGKTLKRVLSQATEASQMCEINQPPHIRARRRQVLGAL